MKESRAISTSVDRPQSSHRVKYRISKHLTAGSILLTHSEGLRSNFVATYHVSVRVNELWRSTQLLTCCAQEQKVAEVAKLPPHITFY